MKNKRVEGFLFRIVTSSALNRLLRLVLRPVAALHPGDLVCRIPVVGEIRLCLPGGGTLLLINDGADQIASKLYWGGLGCYEPGTIAVYFDLLRQSRVVFDVGANTGLFALLAAVDDSRREVHAFEPLPRVFAYLARNIAANGLSNVKAVMSVVAERDGSASLFEPLTVTLPSSASTLRGFVCGVATREVALPGITLDSYVSSQGSPPVDLIKVDVEGTEDKVLEGALRIIRRDHPAVLCEVLRRPGEPAGQRMKALLSTLGYRFLQIRDNGLVETGEIEGGTTESDWNYLFITEKRLGRLSVPVRRR